MFTGLSAFPLTPLKDDQVDEPALSVLIERLAASGVDSITALGGTGSYAYLSDDERRRAARIAIAHAGDVPVIIGTGSMRTSRVVELSRDAEQIGAAGLLVGPVGYHELTEDDVLGLYEDLVGAVDIPVIVYDNPGGTPFEFTDDLYQRVASLPGIASIKTPGLPRHLDAARARIRTLRSNLPDTVTVGMSGDSSAAIGLSAGADMWCSVVGGILPEPALSITRLAQAGSTSAAVAESDRLQPLWDVIAQHGGYRVVAAIAELAGLANPGSLPLPIRGLDARSRAHLAQVARDLGLVPSLA